MAGELIITVVGNLTGDPELRFTPSGAAVANFTVAQTPRYRDRETGEFKDGETVFMRCSAWRDLADNIAESLTKGARVWATGELVQRSYADPKHEGVTRYTTELQVQECGPSLRHARARVVRQTRQTDPREQRAAHAAQDAPPAHDPWATAAPAPALV